MDQQLILGRYRPLADLGEGGHGEVVLAFDTRMTRRVAIKRIPVSRGGIERLEASGLLSTGLHEARTAAMLNHPNIVVVHEWDTDLDEAFLIMEHVDGAALIDVLDACAPLDPDEAAAVLRPVCDALTFAHANGVLHLDLKPENVLVTREGLVKVTDFGVASLTNAAGQAISAGGTLGYMPPEQLVGEAVDARCDQWALAALAYELLTGEVPFAADDADEALDLAERLALPRVGEYARDLPPEIDEILGTALAPDPQDRFADVVSFADELLGLLGDAEEGRSALAEIVASLAVESEEEPGEPTLGQVGLWDRLLRWGGLPLRIVSAAASAWLAFSGVAATRLGTASALAVAALTAAAAAAAPTLGIAVGLIVFAAGAGYAFGPLALLGVALFGTAWWLLVVRRGGWAGVIPLLAPAFGTVGLAPSLPLLAGFAAPGSWYAPVAGAASAVVTILASFASGEWVPPFLQAGVPAVASPLSNAAWKHVASSTDQLLPAAVMVVGWSVAAGIMSLACRPGRRGPALLGAVVASVVMLAAVGPWSTGSQRLTSESALHVGASLILMVVVIALGPPVPSEPEDDPDE